jgi:hypothetical protein
MTVSRNAGMGLHIALSDVATNWSDADGNPVALAAINLTSTSGVNLLTTSDLILYTNSRNVNDQVSYSISDGYGGTNIGYINIVVSTNQVFGQSSPSIVSANGGIQITFYGVPGYTYIVQRNLVDVGNESAWLNFSTNTAAANNPVILVTDTNNPQAFYRLKWQP